MRYITQGNIAETVLNTKSDSEKNGLFSPTCNVAFFHLLCELVDQKSKDIVERWFQFNFLHMESFLKSFNRDDKKLATKIFQIATSPLEKESETLVKEKFSSEIETVEETIDPVDLEKIIEEWLKTYTNGTFTELIKGPSINKATSYNINWAKIFDTSKTTKEKFQYDRNASMDVDMMNISGKFKYFETETTKIIELPCVNKAGIRSKDLSVFLYLPNDSHYMSMLSEHILKELINKMENADVEVSIPKFKIRNECDIMDVIGAQFMVSESPAFSLTKFLNANSYVSKIITQGFLEVNEDNIIAVATTGCDMCFQPLLKEMLIESDVTNRFAKTLLKHKFYNPSAKAQETTFSVILPENAFITEFEMIIEGKSYKSYIKEKEEAKKTYDEAVASGRSAAHVAVSARDSNKFTVSVNVAPKSEAQFLLTYEELLERKLNQYELILNIHPGLLLEKINVKVNIEESSKIRFVKTPPIRSGNEITENVEENTPQTTVEVDNSKAVIQFAPDRESQKQIAKALKQPEHGGIAGQFVVQYDVDMNEPGGEVLLRDGYFVHFYVPDDLPVLPKHVVFALDTSGSMSGRKIMQLRDAMTYILDQILPEDLISLLDFKHNVIVHDVENRGSVSVEFPFHENFLECMHKFEQKGLPQPKQATKEILESAKIVAKQLMAGGSTHMIGALEVSLFLVNRAKEQWKNHQPIIVFLTDGEPTDGVRIPDQITDIITKLNMDTRVPIFTLSFGEEADKDFLRKLSLKNYAFSRHIYEAADASLQLQQFYKQISSPVMSNVTFKYEDNVEDITRVNFPIYFRGCDLVICGRYEVPQHLGAVRCHRNGLDVLLNPRVKESFGPLERFWAFLTVKQMLEKSKYSEDREVLRKKALELALKYSFVTEVTSLVVVKPEANAAVEPENAAATQERKGGYNFGMPQNKMLRGGGLESKRIPRGGDLETKRNRRSKLCSAQPNSGYNLFGAQPQSGHNLFAAQPRSGYNLFAAQPQSGHNAFLAHTMSGSRSGGDLLSDYSDSSDDEPIPDMPTFGSPAMTTHSAFANTGLFGSSSVSTGAATTGLFGSSSVSTGAAPTGLFGSSSVSTGAAPTGLFGSSSVSTGAAPTGFSFGTLPSSTYSPHTGNYQIRTPLKKRKDEEEDSSPRRFKADKPFFIILQSKYQDETVALFIGKISKPVY